MGEQIQVDEGKSIDHSNPIPYYFQLKEILVDEIKSERWQPGQQIPSEFKLCDRFNVSRTVVRQAINKLVQEEFLLREKGRGTFVRKPKIEEYLFQNLSGFYEEMLSIGIKPVTKVLEQNKEEVHDNKISRKLGMNSEELVIKIKRLRFINNEPFVLATTYIPYKICPSLIEEDMTNQSLYSVLEEKYNLKIAYGRRSLEAVSADKQTAVLLGVRVGTPLMLLNSISYLDDGRPIEYFHALHRGDRSKFVTSLIRVRNHSTTSVEKNIISNLRDTGLISP